jgi:hypothetical protein
MFRAIVRKRVQRIFWIVLTPSCHRTIEWVSTLTSVYVLKRSRGSSC